jgi:hypothetical protein
MQDWSTVTLSGAFSALFTAAILGFWKPWLAAYGKEKGRTLARKEDLADILDEVKAITSAQKNIEDKLVGDFWVRRTAWAQKRNVYGRLLVHSNELRTLYHVVPTLLKHVSKASSDAEAIRTRRQLTTQFEKIASAHKRFTRGYALAQIFISAESVRVIDVQLANKTGEEGSEAWALGEAEKYESIWHQLTETAKTDLHST